MTKEDYDHAVAVLSCSAAKDVKQVEKREKST
jgi:hypothetical protein